MGHSRSFCLEPWQVFWTRNEETCAGWGVLGINFYYTAHAHFFTQHLLWAPSPRVVWEQLISISPHRIVSLTIPTDRKADKGDFWLQFMGDIEGSGWHLRPRSAISSCYSHYVPGQLRYHSIGGGGIFAFSGALQSNISLVYWRGMKHRLEQFHKQDQPPASNLQHLGKHRPRRYIFMDWI